MGYILPEVYKQICQMNGQEMPKIFIETGTFKGGIPHRMLETNKSLDPFEKLYTIELGEDICKVASFRYKLFEQREKNPLGYYDFHTDDMDEDFKNWGEYFNGRLCLINGDSSEELNKLTREYTGIHDVCFWLDAHAGAQRYVKGDKDVPLLEELQAIKDNYQGQKHVICIDDAHLFGTKQRDSKSGQVTCDYSQVTYERVKNAILEINPNYNIGVYEPYGMSMIIGYLET